jgi:fucose 4-O-acetylase-like acetyltransferase
MAKVTIGFGVLLIVVGSIGFVLTGSAHPTALIPTWFGLALVILGALGRTEDARKRMLWMHIAVTVGLVGFLFPGVMAVMAYVKAHGGAPARPAATQEQAMMAVVCLVFVAMCIRSFIAVRRGRDTQG